MRTLSCVQAMRRNDATHRTCAAVPHELGPTAARARVGVLGCIRTRARAGASATARLGRTAALRQLPCTLCVPASPLLLLLAAAALLAGPLAVAVPTAGGRHRRCRCSGSRRCDLGRRRHGDSCPPSRTSRTVRKRRSRPNVGAKFRRSAPTRSLRACKCRRCRPSRRGSM